MKQKHPIQPLAKDGQGTLRFKQNAIVRHLLDYASSRGCSLNEIARMQFSDEDRQQLAQLIGYSLSGYGELSSYVDDDAYEVAATMAEQPKLTEEQARIRYLEGALRAIKDGLRKPVAALFGIHPEDLKN